MVTLERSSHGLDYIHNKKIVIQIFISYNLLLNMREVFDEIRSKIHAVFLLIKFITKIYVVIVSNEKRIRPEEYLECASINF